MTFVLAVDPGGTSGWAEASTIDLKSSLTWGELTPAYMAQHLRRWCLDARAHPEAQHVLVMERFTITAQTGKLSPQHDALELIGLSRYLAEWSGVEFDVTQAPDDAKSFAHNDALRRWGVWVPKLGHARDAVRHLCLYAAKQGVFLD